MADRDLDRVAADLLVLSHADPERLAAVGTVASDPISKPVDLNRRRVRGLLPETHGPAPHARAS
jgi:hypothetical protein